MNKVLRNMLFGVFGKTASSLATFLVLPLYLPILGEEAFGLIAISAAAAAMVTFATATIEPVVTREIASRLAKKEETWPVLRAQEYLVYGMALLLLVLTPFLADAVVGKLKLSDLDPATATTACQLLILAISFDVMARPYFAVTMGRQQQYISSCIFALRSWGEAIGGYIVLATTGSVLGFFIIFLGVRVLAWLAAMISAWYPIRGDFFRWRLRKGDLTGLKGFVFLNLLLALLGTFSLMAVQWIIATFLPAAALGIYRLAGVPSATWANLSGNLRQALMPRLCELRETSEEAAHGSLEKGAELLALSSIPMLCAIAVFPEPLILLWLRDSEWIEKLALTMSLLSLASAFVIPVHLLSDMEFTKGIVRYNLFYTGAHVVVLCPAAYFAVQHFGLVGYAATSLIFAILAVPIFGIAMFRRYAPTASALTWMIRCVARPFAISMAVGIGIRMMGGIIGTTLLGPALTAAIASILVILMSKFLRAAAFEVTRSLWTKLSPPTKAAV